MTATDPSFELQHQGMQRLRLVRIGVSPAGQTSAVVMRPPRIVRVLTYRDGATTGGASDERLGRRIEDTQRGRRWWMLKI